MKNYLAKQNRRRVCLCLIARDEESVIARCIASVALLVDGVVLSDTGSQDATLKAAAIAAFSRGLKYHEQRVPWLNFAHNRNAALDFARSKGYDWALMIDADEQLFFQDPADPSWGIDLKDYDAIPFCSILTRSGGTSWYRTQLINLNYRPKVYWVGVVHEYLEAQRAPGINLNGVVNIPSTDGARSKVGAAEKYSGDASALEVALGNELDPHLRARYEYYLAASYRDAGQYSTAVDAFVIRQRNTAGWIEERYLAYLQGARLARAQGLRDDDTTLAWLFKATALCWHRYEALQDLTDICRANAWWPMLVTLLEPIFAHGYALTEPVGFLVEPAIYTWRLLDNYGLALYYSAGRRSESADVYAHLLCLKSSSVDANTLHRFKCNLAWASNTPQPPPLLEEVVPQP